MASQLKGNANHPCQPHRERQRSGHRACRPIHGPVDAVRERDLGSRTADPSHAMAALTGDAGLATSRDDDATGQIAELYLLQAAFHRAASVHNPDGLDTQDTLDQRIADMLALWADGGSLTLNTVSPARTFEERGEPGTASCAPGSNTLCDFFTNVAGSFQPDNRFVSLAPAYKLHLELDGDKATIYFECHYFDANTWQAKNHVNFDGTAKKVNGRWLFWQANASGVGVPYP